MLEHNRSNQLGTQTTNYGKKKDGQFVRVEEREYKRMRFVDFKNI
jgi:hypothetical protein